MFVIGYPRCSCRRPLIIGDTNGVIAGISDIRQLVQMVLMPWVIGMDKNGLRNNSLHEQHARQAAHDANGWNMYHK